MQRFLYTGYSWGCRNWVARYPGTQYTPDTFGYHRVLAG